MVEFTVEYEKGVLILTEAESLESLMATIEEDIPFHGNSIIIRDLEGKQLKVANFYKEVPEKDEKFIAYKKGLGFYTPWVDAL